MRACQPSARNETGRPRWSRQSTWTSSGRATSALNSETLRHPSKNSTSAPAVIDARIDQHLERYRAAAPLGQAILRRRLLQLDAVLDHRKLQRNTHLRRGQTDRKSVAHGLPHPLDQLLHFTAAN